MDTKREQWYVTNVSNSRLSIGDLPLVPEFAKGQTHDILRYYSIQKISQSLVLVNLIKNGKMTLKKDRPDDPNSGVNIDVNLIDRSTTIAERDEAFGGADEIGLRRSWFGL